MWAGSDWTWHKPVLRNDVITTEAYLKDVIEHQTRFAGRSFQQIYHVDFFNQHGDRVAEGDSWVFRTDRDEARGRGTKYTEARERGVEQLSENSWPNGASSTPTRKSAAPPRAFERTSTKATSCRAS
jgi:hypothetical protein